MSEWPHVGRPEREGLCRVPLGRARGSAMVQGVWIGPSVPFPSISVVNPALARLSREGSVGGLCGRTDAQRHHGERQRTLGQAVRAVGLENRRVDLPSMLALRALTRRSREANDHCADVVF